MGNVVVVQLRVNVQLNSHIDTQRHKDTEEREIEKGSDCRVVQYTTYTGENQLIAIKMGFSEKIFRKKDNYDAVLEV